MGPDGSADAAPARPGRGEKCPHGVTNGITLGQCPEDECTDDWEDLQVCRAGGCSDEQVGNARCEPGACEVIGYITDMARVRGGAS